MGSFDTHNGRMTRCYRVRRPLLNSGCYVCMLAKIVHNGLTIWYSEEFIEHTKKALAWELHSGCVSYSGLKKQLDTTR